MVIDIYHTFIYKHSSCSVLIYTISDAVCPIRRQVVVPRGLQPNELLEYHMYIQYLNAKIVHCTCMSYCQFCATGVGYELAEFTSVWR